MLKMRICLIIISLCLLSCKVRVSQADSLEHDYVESYKKAVLYGCLNEVTEGDFQKSLIKNNDLGLYTEAQVLFHAVCDRAKQRGENYAHSIETVSLPDAEGSEVTAIVYLMLLARRLIPLQGLNIES